MPHSRHFYLRYMPFVIILVYIVSVFITCLAEWEHDHKHVTPQITARSSTDIVFPPTPETENDRSAGKLIGTLDNLAKISNSLNINPNNVIGYFILFSAFLSFSSFLFIPAYDRTNLNISLPRIHLLIQRFLN